MSLRGREPRAQPMSLHEFEKIVEQMHAQPPWRAQADRCADYADGNQLDAEVLQRQKDLGVPPAKEDVIGPAVRAVCGYEAKTRTDWRVSADATNGVDEDGEDIAAALNFELNQAERFSGADRALGAAFRSMLTTGVGWVEVGRNASSLQFPFECRMVHRNEIFWDMAAKEDNLRDARWMVRRRWVDVEQAVQLFPEAEAVLQGFVRYGFDYADMNEGGVSTALQNDQFARRAWTRAEDYYFNQQNNQVCISEVWYRRFVKVQVLVSGYGSRRRAVLYDEDNDEHLAMLHAGRARLDFELQSRIRRAYWVGPNCLSDEASPYAHGRFPYVPLFGWREDMTGVPYGIVRNMVFLQDCLNAAKSRLIWGMTAVQVQRTEDVVSMTDEQLRRTIAMPSADIVLDSAAMSMPGARFEVKRDFPLNEQHFHLMNDARNAIRAVSGITAAFDGAGGNATSGLQEQTQVEQSQMALAEFFDNFNAARTEVGELLLAMIIEDLGDNEYAVRVEGNVFKPPRQVVLNELMPVDGSPKMRRRMAVKNTRLRVALEDVPTSSSFRAQQLASLTEAIKSAPAQVQLAMLPYLFDLMPIPHKNEVTALLRQAGEMPDPELMKAQAVEEARAQLQFELRERELEIKAQQVQSQAALNEAKVSELMQKALQSVVQAAYSANQTAAQIAQQPQIAAIGDSVLQFAAEQSGRPLEVDPDIGVPQADVAPMLADASLDKQQELQVRQNSSPMFPPVPQMPVSPLQGIETERVADNLG